MSNEWEAIQNERARRLAEAQEAEKKEMARRKKIVRRIISLIVLVAIVIGFGIASFGLFEHVPAGYICVIQSPVKGTLAVYTEPGTKWQGFGKVTLYPRSGVFEFMQPGDPNDPDLKKMYDPKKDKSLKIAFNDGGDAWISGSIRYDYPLEHEQIKLLHKMFSSHENVMNGLISKTVERSVYMTGPLMSSIDSAMVRKADLPKYIEDQARNGLYDVITKEVIVEDEITRETKRIKVAEPIKNATAPNGFQRQEESVLSKYGLSLSNFSTQNVTYSDGVQKRILALFDAQSDIQIATLNAKKAEQDKKTEEEKGKATATAAEWKAKTIAAEEIAAAEKEASIMNIQAERDKQVAVTQAERNKEVAELDKQTAALYKDATLLRAEADAEAKRKIMQADGALAQKLDAYVKVQQAYASAIQGYKGNWVPGIMTGGAGADGSNAATQMMEFLTIKAAKDLSLDLSVTGR